MNEPFKLNPPPVYDENYAATQQDWDEGPGLTLDANDARFLAARLRRLFAHFDYPLPDFAADDARLIGIAASAIGALLTRWETEGPTWHAVISNAAPGINKAVRRADVADEYAQECRRNGYEGVEVVPLYAHAQHEAREAALRKLSKLTDEIGQEL